MNENYSDYSPINHDADIADVIADVCRQEVMLKTGALQSAILNSSNFSLIATDEKGIIQLFKPLRVNEFMDTLDVALEFAETFAVTSKQEGGM